MADSVEGKIIFVAKKINGKYVDAERKCGGLESQEQGVNERAGNKNVVSENMKETR